MYELDDEQFKWEFFYCKSNNNIENNDSLTLYVCKASCLKKPYNKLVINLDRMLFYIRTSPCGLGPYSVKTSIWHFPVMTVLSVNKELLLMKNQNCFEALFIFLPPSL